MTLDEIKTELKNANPTLQRGSDEDGYEQITGDEYEAIIQSWAEAAYAKELKSEEEAVKKAAAEAKLAALGLTAEDLKAVGLG